MKSIVGTPLYMSPQILKRTKYTAKSDLWSIGLMYYEMLNGRTPWPAHN
jgi:serine/threonine-protein kinase ULK/ATG1